MKATYKTTRTNGTHIYSVTGTPAEMTAFKAAKGAYYLEDTSEGIHKGKPLYFTSRALCSTTEYKLVGANLEAETSTTQVAILDALASVGKLNLNDLQKFAAMKAAGLL